VKISSSLSCDNLRTGCLRQRATLAVAWK